MVDRGYKAFRARRGIKALLRLLRRGDDPLDELTPAKGAGTLGIMGRVVEKAIRESLERPTGELTEKDLEEVTYLEFGSAQITDAGLKEVAKLEQLSSLSLPYTEITDEGLKEVAKLQQLKELSLEDTQITDAGLKEVVKLQQLEKLDLLFCEQITDAGLMEVDKLQNLKLLIHPGIDMTD